MKNIYVIAALLFLFPLSSAWAQDDDGVTSYPVTQSPEDVIEYWTPERMKNAKPMPMPSIMVPPGGERSGQIPAPAPKIQPGEEAVFCTQEAMICPDGSAVSRQGLDCAFAPCPGQEPIATEAAPEERPRLYLRR